MKSENNNKHSMKTVQFLHWFFYISRHYECFENFWNWWFHKDMYHYWHVLSWYFTVNKTWCQRKSVIHSLDQTACFTKKILWEYLVGFFSLSSFGRYQKLHGVCSRGQNTTSLWKAHLKCLLRTIES